MEVDQDKPKAAGSPPHKRDQGVRLDSETRRKKQQELMVHMAERKVRSRAQQIYESRGQTEGQDVQDWLQAESEVIGNSILAPLYRRLRTTENQALEYPTQQPAGQSTCSDSGA